jgi:hypothetical protein
VNAGWTWLRFGAVAEARPEESEPLLNAFMPNYDIVERHHVEVGAPAAVTFEAANTAEIKSFVSQALFVARAIALGGERDRLPRPRGFRELMQSIGWAVLAEVPGREVVFGAVTTPWEPEPVFRPVGGAHFAGFDEPGFVKIVLTLRADPTGDDTCVFRTETRAMATDPLARARFRRYWAFVVPGVRLIRHGMIASVKTEAERRVREAAAA